MLETIHIVFLYFFTKLCFHLSQKVTSTDEISHVIWPKSYLGMVTHIFFIVFFETKIGIEHSGKVYIESFEKIYV